MPTKEILTLAALSARLSADLQKYENAAGSTITVQFILHEPDDEGCNWSDSVILKSGPKTTKKALAPRAAQLIKNARKRYEVV